MAVDLNKIKARLNSLTNSNQKSNLIWKPKPGKQEVRIVPYKYCPDNPFIELLFHYNIDGKTYLSPESVDKADPITEFANKLKRTGDKEDWKSARQFEPKMRTFVPVLVRGEEHEGVKFWGFGKQVYQELLSFMSDSDYGDITDLANGRDIVVEFRTIEETKKNFPETVIRVKPNTKPAVDPSNKELMAVLANQTQLLDLFQLHTYEELEQVVDQWLNPKKEGDVEGDEGVSDDVSYDDTPVTTPKVKPDSKKTGSGTTTADANAFDELFNA